ncbi:MAG: DUF5677 domain-containing protein [Candidatus Omnitrophica bacterium]|nr:DUF5677 domain-containing protein [Candidatus Omnitrophota bacterium]
MKYVNVAYKDLIKELIDFSNGLFPLRINGENNRHYVILSNHVINTQTILSIRLLNEQKHTNDVSVLLRSMFESVIDMGLLSQKIVRNDVGRYIGFSSVEVYKRHVHLTNIRPKSIREAVKMNYISSLEEVEKEMLRYKKRYGDIKSWCGLNLLERSRLVDKHFPPTVGDSNFYDFLYSQVFRICSSSTHRTYLGLSSINFRKRKVLDDTSLFPESSVEQLLHVCEYAIFTYLSSVRFLGKAFGIDKCESFYQSLLKKIFTVKNERGSFLICK